MRELVSPAFWLSALAALILIFVVPLVAEVYTLYNFTVFAVLAMLALSLGLVWGMGGILALGQSAFFGIGAYVYALLAVNLGDSTWAVLAAVIVPAAVAVLIGYFTFFGRISDVYFAVISLTIPLILLSLINSASGPAYQFGKAHLGGYNGIPAVPPLNNPFNPAHVFSFEGMYYVAALALLLVYLGLRVLVAGRFGRVVEAIRENELRAELLGYDVRYYKLGVFCIGAAIAGLAGAFYAAWGASVGPTVFSLSFTAQAVVWVLFGGLGTLLGPIVGCFLVQGLSTWLGSVSRVSPEIALGTLFIVAVLLVPNGIVPAIRNRLRARPARIPTGAP
ncbi:MAG TPA: branched-chain amino acid ABC transporter permease [Pusillimonas sp.]|uniref:branched-chain amino acid ABC transporter permease n=1 Tax=Pusillimonas sp. TaxID=3040095 RepID=UPI002B9124B2|nr:branched-chain amino acid ABC transporter permease [Pusillimonas sp.]HUH87117.1 branched-chain amino acid ABC transporter permease [Pusillimonas sp.]